VNKSCSWIKNVVLHNHPLLSFDDAKLVGLVCLTTNKIDKESCFPRRSEVFCHINRGGRKFEQSGGVGGKVIILYVKVYSFASLSA
jgi:hypothetical protein